jgi:superfamily I DNA and/or RNA helicase
LSPESKKFGFARSLQERLMMRNRYHFSLLNTQYRMKPDISQWPIARFYDAKVQDGENVKSPKYGSQSTLLLTGQPYVWVPVTGKEKKNTSGSTYNETEIDAVVSLILDFKKKAKVSNKNLASPDYLRILTFYKAQEQKLREKLEKYQLKVTVSTVDAGQGCEADIVILSFVRGAKGKMGFITDMQRLNVALTRAKYQLICVGDVRSIGEIEQRGGHFELIDMAQDATVRSYMANPPGPLPASPLKRKFSAQQMKKKNSSPAEKKPKQDGNQKKNGTKKKKNKKKKKVEEDTATKKKK